MTDPIEPVAALPPDLDPDLAMWLEMAEAHAFLDTYSAAAEQPGNPAGAATAVIGEAVAFGLTVFDVGFFTGRSASGRAGGHEGRRGCRRRVLSRLRLRSRRCTSPRRAAARPPRLDRRRGLRARRSVGEAWHDLRGIDEPSPTLRVERSTPRSRRRGARRALQRSRCRPRSCPSRPRRSDGPARPITSVQRRDPGEHGGDARRGRRRVARLRRDAPGFAAAAGGGMLLRRLRKHRDGLRWRSRRRGRRPGRSGQPLHRNMFRVGFHLGTSPELVSRPRRRHGDRGTSDGPHRATGGPSHDPSATHGPRPASPPRSAPRRSPAPAPSAPRAARRCPAAAGSRRPPSGCS